MHECATRSPKSNPTLLGTLGSTDLINVREELIPGPKYAIAMGPRIPRLTSEWTSGRTRHRQMHTDLINL